MNPMNPMNPERDTLHQERFTLLVQSAEEKVMAELSERLTEKGIGDVLVVGGGISGIQASLDLAAAGFKVFLVEKSPAIGGHMAQLDKTFPTNDCSM